MPIFRILLPLLLVGFVCVPLTAQPGTTHRVETITYDSPQEGRFIFPAAGKRYEKVLMHYRLRCPYNAQCGEWDYLMYIYLYDHTGLTDSTADTAASFRVDGMTPDSFSFRRSPSWRYQTHQRFLPISVDTSSLVTRVIGAGAASISLPFGDPTLPGRTRLLLTKGELQTAGATAGPLSGIRLDALGGGGSYRDVVIRVATSMADTLAVGVVEPGSMTLVHRGDLNLAGGGMKTIRFARSFDWDGSSSIILDIAHAGGGIGDPLLVKGDSVGGGLVQVVEGNARVRRFEGNDYIDVPKEAFDGIETKITIAFRARNNPLYQPQNQSIFEAADENGRRILNMHLPWGDRTMYWDAGTSTGYDRVTKQMDSTLWDGRWNHWVVMKDAAAGTMRVYLNGRIWASASGKTRTIGAIETFRIGSFANATNFFDGDVEDFAIWDTTFDATTVAALAAGTISPSTLAPDDLRILYRFDNDPSPAVVFDESGGGRDGNAVGYPGLQDAAAWQLGSSGTDLTTRPTVTLEFGGVISAVDTLHVVDSTMTDPLMVVRYLDFAAPGRATDTLSVWPVTDRILFAPDGTPTDTIAGVADSVLYQVHTPYWRTFERVDRYEIGRYITPYGNGLNLGNGFTWTYDVTDYQHLLHDTVHLAAYNQQELLNLTFEMIEGTPPRDVLSLRNLWVGAPGYGLQRSIEEFLTPRTVMIDPATEMARVKMRTTGHGFGGTDNCAEFCPRHHFLKVDGTTRYDTLVWKYDCGLNPVYPQGGTWVYNRSNWCPGDLVPTYDLEITPWITPGDSVTLDYDVEPYTWNGQGSTPYYAIETQLVEYGAPNHTLDASIEAIKSPSDVDAWRRLNPICSNPVVTIRNTGSTPLTSLKITYGVVGAEQVTYDWSGNLGFLESTDVTLGAFPWNGTGKRFAVRLSEPNGGGDQYARNDTMSTGYRIPPMYPSRLSFELKTNNYGGETSYELRDAAGNVILSKSALADATIYRDTVSLAPGCYEFRLQDLGGDGLSWWANRQYAGDGYMRIREADRSRSVITFNADFGSEIYQQFTVGYDIASAPSSEQGEKAQSIAIWPNPTDGVIHVEMSLPRVDDAVVTVRDLLGTTLYELPVRNVSEQAVAFDLSSKPAGTYVVTVATSSGSVTRKVVVR